jgi:hypothetical protein
MARTPEEKIRKLAGNCCEYCRLPEGSTKFGHVLDHIVARQHGGETSFENLALCCGNCNQFKGPNIAGLDPLTGKLTPLFHPRRNRWHNHFRWDGALLVGKTAIGRATVRVLSINDPLRVALRRALQDET